MKKSRRQKPCPKCGTLGIRIDKYDCYACPKCIIWLENGCSDVKCDFCSSRPETPIYVDWSDPFNT